MKQHQKEAIELFEKSKRGILLCDGMGMGKTRVAAQLIADHPGAIVFWKPSVRTQFRSECRRHHEEIGEDPQTFWLTVNNAPYASLRNVADRHSKSVSEFLEGRLVIIDEAHNLARNICRSATSKDDKGAVKLYQAFVRARSRFLIVTATPTDGDDRLLGVYYGILTGDTNHRPRRLSGDRERLSSLAAVTHFQNDHESLPRVQELRLVETTDHTRSLLSTLVSGLNLVYCSPSMISRLEEAFIAHGMSALDKDFSKASRYVVLGSATTDFQQRRHGTIVDCVNSYENRYGEICRIVVITQALVEGLDLRNVVAVHVIGVESSLHNAHCAIGRARRLHSHDDLPSDQRTVSCFLYHTEDDRPRLDKALDKHNHQRRLFNELKDFL